MWVAAESGPSAGDLSSRDQVRLNIPGGFFGAMEGDDGSAGVAWPDAVPLPLSEPLPLTLVAVARRGGGTGPAP